MSKKGSSVFKCETQGKGATDFTKRAQFPASLRLKAEEPQKGTLEVSGIGIYSGVINVQDGATLILTDDDLPATHTFQQGSRIDGPGQVIFGGSDDLEMQIVANHALRIERFRFEIGGTIQGAGQDASTLGARQFEWNVGEIKNLLILAQAGDRMQIGNEGDCKLENAAIQNYGQIDWVGAGNISIVDASYIRNLGSNGEGRFIIRNGQTMLGTSNMGVAPVFELVDGGELRKTGGTMTTMNVLFRNLNGKLDLQGGSLSIGNDYEVGGGRTLLGGGTLSVDRNLNQQGELSEILLGGGMLRAAGINLFAGRLDLGGGTVDLGMGTLDNAGTITGSGDIIGNVGNSGTLIIGGPSVSGTINITGSFTQTSGRLQVEIGGTGLGEADRLNVTGDVNLGGTVEIWLTGGFLPAPGNLFAFLVFTGQRAGAFGQVTPNGDAANYGWTFEYSSDSAGLRVQ